MTGWWFGTSILFSHILGMSSSQLTNIFQRDSNHQPDDILTFSQKCDSSEIRSSRNVFENTDNTGLGVAQRCATKTLSTLDGDASTKSAIWIFQDLSQSELVQNDIPQGCQRWRHTFCMTCGKRSPSTSSLPFSGISGMMKFLLKSRCNFLYVEDPHPPDICWKTPRDRLRTTDLCSRHASTAMACGEAQRRDREDKGSKMQSFGFLSYNIYLLINMMNKYIYIHIYIYIYIYIYMYIHIYTYTHMLLEAAFFTVRPAVVGWFVNPIN